MLSELREHAGATPDAWSLKSKWGCLPLAPQDLGEPPSERGAGGSWVCVWGVFPDPWASPRALQGPGADSARPCGLSSCCRASGTELFAAMVGDSLQQGCPPSWRPLWKDTELTGRNPAPMRVCAAQSRRDLRGRSHATPSPALHAQRLPFRGPTPDGGAGR